MLIPKVENPSTSAEFWPISLCKFVHKILTKVIALWLSTLLPSIICENHASFVKGCNITNNFFLALELTSFINRRTRGGNLIFILDLQKAFDRVSWDFLQQVLHFYGFSTHFGHLIENITKFNYFLFLSMAALLVLLALLERLNKEILYPLFFFFNFILVADVLWP